MEVYNEIANSKENQRSNDFDRENSTWSSPKVSWCLISVTESLTNEDGPFKIEKIDWWKNIWKTSIHNNEEDNTSKVLNVTDLWSSFINVKNNGDNSKKYGLNHFQNNIKRLSELIDPISLENTKILVNPWTVVIMSCSFNLINVLCLIVMRNWLERTDQMSHSLFKLFCDLFVRVLFLLFNVM